MKNYYNNFIVICDCNVELIDLKEETLKMKNYYNNFIIVCDCNFEFKFNLFAKISQKKYILFKKIFQIKNEK